MAKKGRSIRRSIALAIFANLLAFFISAISFFFITLLLRNVTLEKSKINLLAGSAALVLWCISCGLFVLLTRYGEPFKKNLKYIGYCFPLTTFFVWAFEQRSLRLKAEEKLRKLESIVNSMTKVRTIAGMVDPEKQKETLGNIINEMDNQVDHDLAQIVTNIRCYVEDILTSVGDNGHYELFRQLIDKVSFCEPGERPETCRDFLWFLSDVFGMPPKGCFTRQVQKDMIGPLKNAIWRVDKPNLNRVGGIIQQIMADEEDEYDLAGQILEMLEILDWRKEQEVCQIIFNESKKRAFKFTQRFGFVFLSTLRKLGHKVFWLNIQSLMEILEEAIKNGDKGLLNLKQNVYKELCSTVFAPLEDEKKPGVHSNRVFRRLMDNDGCVKVECELPDGSSCTCDAESLSFRGLYSKKCPLKEGEKLKTRIIPIVEFGKPKPKHEFHLSASVAKLHQVEASKQSIGRGIFFEEAEENDVKDLYDYISEHRK